MNITRAEFLEQRKIFSLGKLTTEEFLLPTSNLSQLAQTDTGAAVELLQQVDVSALMKTKSFIKSIYDLHQIYKKVFTDGGRIFISGSGATGRLALILEKIIWGHEKYKEKSRLQKTDEFKGGEDLYLGEGGYS